MNLEFVNGTNLQKSACRTVAHNLLNLPFDSISLTHKVEFTPDPLPSSHNEFAYTTFTYGSSQATTKIASVAPNWPEPWRGVKFLQETYAHELGHALFASLPKTKRTEIAKMFGAKSDDVDELLPEGVKWENQIGEGIAETFKDAFLPQRYRRYANRTNHKLSISRYPEFRKVFREGFESSTLELVSPDGTDVNKENGLAGKGLYTGSFEEEPGSSTYFGQGIYVQLAKAGEPVSGAIERLDFGSHFIEAYQYRLNFQMGWANNFISAPVTEINLPKNAGAGWRSASFGEFSGTSGPGELFTFSKPVWVYSGTALQIISSIEFLLDAEFEVFFSEGWAKPEVHLFVEGSTPKVTADFVTPSYPKSPVDYYLFSEIEVPISTSTGVLHLEAEILASRFDPNPISQADMTEGVADLFGDVREPIVVPVGKTQPLGYNGGTRRSTSRVVGARL